MTSWPDGVRAARIDIVVQEAGVFQTSVAVYRATGAPAAGVGYALDASWENAVRLAAQEAMAAMLKRGDATKNGAVGEPKS